MGRKNVKSAQAVEIMQKNAKKSMAEVSVMIAKALDVSENEGRAYYTRLVRSGAAPGEIEFRPRGRKSNLVKSQEAKKARKKTSKKKTEEVVEAVQKAPEPVQETVPEEVPILDIMDDDPADYVPAFLR